MSTNIANLLTEHVNGSTFIGINTTTTARLKGGKGNPFKDRITKVNVGSNVMVFQNKTTNAYDNMVKRRLKKEGKSADSFSLSPRTWGTRIAGTPFVKHKENFYVEVIFLSNGHSHYEVDGVKSDIQPEWNLATTKPDTNSQGGLSDKVIIRTFKVASITSITIDGNTYDDLRW